MSERTPATSDYIARVREMELQTGKKFVEGLCCECGHHLTKWRSPKYTEASVRVGDEVSAFEHATFIAQCPVCRARTKHAHLRHDKARNFFEDTQRLATLGGPVPSYMIKPGFPGAETAEMVRDRCEYRYWHTVERELLGEERAA